MSPLHGPSPRVRAYVEWVLRHGRLLWVVALLLAIPATIRTVSLYAHLRSEVEELLPRNAPSVKALDELRARLHGAQFLGVVVEGKDASELPAAERFLDDLKARVAAYPKTMVAEVRTGGQVERAFIEKHAGLYVDLADLVELKKRITARKEWEEANAFGANLDDEKPPSIDVSDLQKKYENKEDLGARFSSKDLHASMLSIEASDFNTGSEAGRALLLKVQADVAALDPHKYAPGLRVGYASDVAINVEELDALKEDLSLSTVLVIAAVIGVIVLYYRWWRSILALFPPLLIAVVYAFALASLPPTRVTELNSNTAFLGSIIIGNGINVGLILLARFREERLSGTSVHESIVIGVWGAAPGTLAAAAAAGVSYASLVVTEFRGFRQFGVIGGLGMLASWLTAFLLMPPLLRWLDHDTRQHQSAARAHGVLTTPLLRFIERAAPVLAVAAMVLGIAASVRIARSDRATVLEHDFNKLRRRDTWQNGEGYWGRKMDALLGHYLTPTVVLCDSEEQARELGARLRVSVDKGSLTPFIARMVTIDDVLPRDQDKKLAELAEIRKLITPRMRASLDDDKRKKLDELLGAEQPRALSSNDLPSGLIAGLREKSGVVGRTILLYPRPSDALWKADGIHGFVTELRKAAEGVRPGGVAAARVAGSIPMTEDILESIGHDAPIASIVSFVGVLLVVIVVVRERAASSWVIGSLLMGVLWLAGATLWLRVKINFTNFIAFPITFGIGVDYAVNVMTRYVQDEHDITGAVRSTGGAVALCSATTIIGYSSLLLAKNNALFLFGLLAVMGEIACLSAAILVLPAALFWWQQRKPAKPTAST